MAGRLTAGDREELAAGMIATLSHELEGKVAHDLVADIVLAVLDEGRHGAQGRALDVWMLQARERLQRFIRARSSQ